MLTPDEEIVFKKKKSEKTELESRLRDLKKSAKKSEKDS
jgi:hypothetical protein